MTREQREQLFSSNLDLATYVVNKHWALHYIDREELESESKLHLWDATESFDESRGVKFSTYAYKFIRNELSRFAYHVIFGSMNNTSSLQDAIRYIKQELRKGKTIEQIYSSAPSQLSQKYIKCVNDAFCQPSLQAEVYTRDDARFTFEDTLADSEDLESEVVNKLRNAELFSYVYSNFPAYAKERQKYPVRCDIDEVISLFLDNIFVKKKTLAEVSRELGVSRETTRNYFNRLKKLLQKFVEQNQLLSHDKTKI